MILERLRSYVFFSKAGPVLPILWTSAYILKCHNNKNLVLHRLTFISSTRLSSFNQSIPDWSNQSILFLKDQFYADHHCIMKNIQKNIFVAQFNSIKLPKQFPQFISDNKQHTINWIKQSTSSKTSHTQRYRRQSFSIFRKSCRKSLGDSYTKTDDNKFKWYFYHC